MKYRKKEVIKWQRLQRVIEFSFSRDATYWLLVTEQDKYISDPLCQCLPDVTKPLWLYYLQQYKQTTDTTKVTTRSPLHLLSLALCPRLLTIDIIIFVLILIENENFLKYYKIVVRHNTTTIYFPQKPMVYSEPLCF